VGQPEHFSLELPGRCMTLIERLWPTVETIKQPEHPELGPLTSTFLISMSMPILVLPIERIERQATKATAGGYADDRALSPRLAANVADTLGGRPFRKAPFFVRGSWSFLEVGREAKFNIADGVPEGIAFHLGDQVAFDRAANMPTSQWVSTIRNALSHGGIVYLDADGRSRYDSPVKMFAFISGRYEGERKEILVGLNVLRVSVIDYKEFLARWVNWLKRSGLARRLVA
jgi:hypothetical protein